MKYQKKKTIIKAYQWLGDKKTPVINFPAWILSKRETFIYGYQGDEEEIYFSILTPEGPELSETVYPGDWIIQGKKGKLLRCKPALFELIYEK